VAVYLSAQGVSGVSGPPAGGAAYSVRLGDDGGQEVSAQVSGGWLTFICPPSAKSGSVMAYVRTLGAGGGSDACIFPFLYMPRPAFALPKVLPLSGGRIALSVAGYEAILGEGALCVVRSAL
jgi:hypothetical protein